MCRVCVKHATCLLGWQPQQSACGAVCSQPHNGDVPGNDDSAATFRKILGNGVGILEGENGLYKDRGGQVATLWAGVRTQQGNRGELPIALLWRQRGNTIVNTPPPDVEMPPSIPWVQVHIPPQQPVSIKSALHSRCRRAKMCPHEHRAVLKPSESIIVKFGKAHNTEKPLSVLTSAGSHRHILPDRWMFARLHPKLFVTEQTIESY
ncbi:hypothetical protein B0H14DRAFT_2646248 [Mycena olivaceomarginata]|nr:hypothetical protein B0H14DRAFT_2646248 [Mycena olivaceomarginata]